MYQLNQWYNWIIDLARAKKRRPSEEGRLVREESSSQVLHQPGHRRTRRAVGLDQSAAIHPRTADHVSPERDARHGRMIMEQRELRPHDVQLLLIVGPRDVVLGDVDREAQRGHPVQPA